MVLEAKRTAKMNGSRFFQSERTVRSEFQNLVCHWFVMSYAAIATIIRVFVVGLKCLLLACSKTHPLFHLASWFVICLMQQLLLSIRVFVIGL